MRYALIVAIVLLFPALGLAQTPTADIKCDGLDSGAVVAPGGKARIDFNVVAGTGAGTPVDIWLVLSSPFGMFSYDGSGPVAGWWFDLSHVYSTGPLANDSGTVLDRTIPLGNYTAHIALDDAPNGILNLGNIFVKDAVKFRVALYLNKTLIPEGEYLMGDHYGIGLPNESPVHAVYIDAFYMEVREVTTLQYCLYLNYAYALGEIEVISDEVLKYGDTEVYCKIGTGTSGSRIQWDGSLFSVTPLKENHPMTYVSWFGAAAYANWRSVQEGLTPCYVPASWVCLFGNGGYRLPTEAEWEKASRGGKSTPYYMFPWGNSVDGSKANYAQSGDPFEGTDPETTPVGYYDGNQIPAGADMPNGYGLYDMAGNAIEWCNDWSDLNYYSSSPYNNPRGPASGSITRVRRGGACDGGKYTLRCAKRYNLVPELAGFNSGFRLVLE